MAESDMSMEPFVNLEEKIGKTVGRRTGFANPLSMQGNTKEVMKGWKRALGVPSVPKGVYRFKTHEEADEWMMKMLTRVRKS